jgi:endonuclease YncB( thermonuclease family)
MRTPAFAARPFATPAARRRTGLFALAGAAIAASLALGIAPRSLAAGGAAPAEIVGQASVIDADTIEIHGTRIRLEGVDAPESGQRCLSGEAQVVRCGSIAANALDAFINSNPVSCTIDGKDRYQRLLATCSVRGENIQDWLVRSGHALAYRKYSSRYVEAEAAAKASGAGVWAGQFVMPWDWRKGLRLPGEKPTKAMREGAV